MNRRSWLRQRTLARILVHTTDDKTIEGVLDTVARDGVVLIAGRYLEGDAKVELAGETFIPREKIAFVQVAEAPKPFAA